MTMTHYTSLGRSLRTFSARAVLAAVSIAAIAACNADDLNVPNPNQASIVAASGDPTAFQLLATGLFADERSTRTALITAVGLVGHESYTFTPQEPRNTTNALLGISVAGVRKLDPAGFATGPWGTQYGVLRDIFNFKKTISNLSSLSTAQKAAALGFAQTLEAQMLLEIAQTHDTLGAVVEILEDPAAVAPFVSRDSVYKYILNTLDAAATNLTAGGAAFPFTFAPGFVGFTTPATFTQFNRALKARAAANYATAGGGAAAWATTLAALQASFLNASATSRAALDIGPFYTYGASPDTPNGIAASVTSTLYGHMSFLTDAQKKADGSLDDRYTAKIRTGLAPAQSPATADGPQSGTSTIGFKIWAVNTSPVPIIRNEELILLRAEARLATGDKAGAIADLNVVRQNSGGLPASTLTAGSSTDAILDGILYEKRYSLMMEGQRWPDARRYNRLNTLPLDVTSGPNQNYVFKVFPIPQAECLVRAKLSGEFLGPSGQNNCAP
jgi:hypothetical protein